MIDIPGQIGGDALGSVLFLVLNKCDVLILILSECSSECELDQHPAQPLKTRNWMIYHLSISKARHPFL